LTSTTDIPLLIQNCTFGRPSIIIVNRSLEEKPRKLCHYRTIARTHQNVFIYAHSNQAETRIQDIKQLGAIRNATAIGIVKSELFQEGKILEFIFYSNVYDMIVHHKENNNNFFYSQRTL
jgi:hypothetical protein